MRPIFTPRLVNAPFGDPGLYVDFQFERRALLFDLGELAPLPVGELLRISDVFVSHTHMDHFIGFDRLLRACLGREERLRLFGPPGFLDQVEHKLSAYTWNLVQNYPADFVLEVWEIDRDWRGRGAQFRCHLRFGREPLGERRFEPGTLLDEPAFRVRAALLEHRTPCLGFALEEKTRLSVREGRLAELGLAPGPWLKELKEAAARGAPDDLPLRVRWRDGGGAHERELPLGFLRGELLSFAPGQKISYVTDVSYSEENARRITALAHGADTLFIECVFLQADAAHAARKCHLTARQAGSLARAARARLAVPFHFSPRYAARERALCEEFEAARQGLAVMGDA
jgi:ribonuclease Z